MLVALIPATLALAVTAHEESHPPIKYNAVTVLSGFMVVGQTPLSRRQVEFTNETRVKVEITGEPTWSKKGSTDAVIMTGIAEEHMTARLEIYDNFAWDDVTPMWFRPGMIAVNKSTVSIVVSPSRSAQDAPLW